jgi:hypothetical protein
VVLVPNASEGAALATVAISPSVDNASSADKRIVFMVVLHLAVE